MKKNTIKWRIFKYNLGLIFLQLTLIGVIFSAAFRLYVKNDILQQLGKIKGNELQFGTHLLLFAILIFSGFIIVLFSSLIAKKISAPFTAINQHLKSIAERNFRNKISLPVDDELQEFVNNINVMSEKLETFDQAQKTFLQNASHEFRTPLMSIQSYAEGIKYNVVESGKAADIIIDEAKRLTRLVEDLLYLSRLETIEENYRFEHLDYHELINSCIERMQGIAVTNNIQINDVRPHSFLEERIEISGDGEMLSRAITNIISNCIRYANNLVTISSRMIGRNKIDLTIADDGPGFAPAELPKIFDRFYKGKKGDFGLGLPISKNVIEKHHGKIVAENKDGSALFIIELPLVER